jgi:hypothetical protein
MQVHTQTYVNIHHVSGRYCFLAVRFFLYYMFLFHDMLLLYIIGICAYNILLGRMECQHAGSISPACQAKFFKLEIGGRHETFSVDRLKPHLGLNPVVSAAPPGPRTLSGRRSEVQTLAPQLGTVIPGTSTKFFARLR